MQVIVHSRETIRKMGDPGCPYIVISLYDPRSFPPEIARFTNCKGVLQLCFDDVDARIEDSYEGQVARDEVCITELQGQTIATFVLSHQKRISLIICQCEAGISRSAGAAEAIAEYLGEDHKVFSTGAGPNGRFFPNRNLYWAVRNGFLS